MIHCVTRNKQFKLFMRLELAGDGWVPGETARNATFWNSQVDHLFLGDLVGWYRAFPRHPKRRNSPKILNNRYNTKGSCEGTCAALNIKSVNLTLDFINIPICRISKN